jgi:hypothetical protein
VAFSAYEIVLHGLAARRPRLLLDSDFRVDCFGERFDVVVDASVTRFLPREQFERAYAQVRSVLAAGGRVFASGLAPDRLEHLRSQGLELWFEDSPKQLPHFARQWPSRHSWQVLRLG